MIDVDNDVSIANAAKDLSLVPLWEIYHQLMGSEPAPSCGAHLWSYSKVRPLLARAGREISTDDAERRVLLFKNPDLTRPFATHTLGCGLQMLLGGEVEGGHRHTPAALRFVLEGNGAYTTTDGERIWMSPGDLITTPSWTWHDHGKVTDGEMIWMDGIDVPLINHLGVNFTEYMAGDRQQDATVADGDSHWRFGSAFLPIEGLRQNAYSPIFSYPYDRTRSVLDKLRRDERWDPWHGLKLRYANPQTGGDIMPTIAAFIQLVPASFTTKAYRSTDAAIFCVAEGSGTALIGDKSFILNQHDIFVVPNWTDVCFSAAEDLVIFSYSDRAMQERLAVWRDRRSGKN